MALHMKIQTTSFGAFSDVDMSVLGKVRLIVSSSQPQQLRFRVYAPQHTLPLGIRTFIKFWDDEGVDPDSVAFSESNPTFEGFLLDCDPGEGTGEVEYTAYDSTVMAGREIIVQSTAFVSGSAPTTPPTVDPTGHPRLVLNSTIDNDDDYAFCRDFELTTGEIIAMILDDQYEPLYWLNAAPGTGATGGDTAYVAGDLSALDYEPQEKMVFESEDVRSAVLRVLGMHYPQYRLYYSPKTRKWRFYDVTAATEITLTLNAWKDVDHPILSFEFDRSLEQRATAVRIKGPETLTTEVFSTLDGSLNKLAAGSVVLQNYYNPSGHFDAVGYSRFQIDDADKRRGGRMLPGAISVPMSSYTRISVRSPTLQLSWDGGVTWATVLGTFFDFQDGIAFTSQPGQTDPVYHYFYIDPPPYGSYSDQQYFTPSAWRLIWAYYDVPLSVRYPTSGYDGTAYTVAGQQFTLELYDEMLATGYEYGTPVSTIPRMIQFTKLATAIHAERKDIIYVGGVTLHGQDYRFHQLQRRVHLAAVDSDGAPLTTGWEAAGAVVTDVEYDYEEKTTVIQFSTDQMELIGMDPENLKEMLKVRALTKLIEYTYSGRITFRGDSVVYRNRHVGFIDEQTGEVQTQIVKPPKK